MQHSKDDDGLLASEDHPPLAHSKSKPARHRPAQSTNITNATRGKPIHGTEDAFPSLQR